MSGHHHPPLQRPTQFDPDEFRRIPDDTSDLIGIAAFSRYRQAIEQSAADRSTDIPRSYAVLAMLFQSIAMAAAFAPWGQYQTRDLRIATLRGIEMDGGMLIFFGAIALISSGLVLRLSDTSTAATIGFAATILCTVTGGLNWAFIHSWDVHDRLALAATNTPGWGLVAATLFSLLAAICAFFVMRVARLY